DQAHRLKSVRVFSEMEISRDGAEHVRVESEPKAALDCSLDLRAEEACGLRTRPAAREKPAFGLVLQAKGVLNQIAVFLRKLVSEFRAVLDLACGDRDQPTLLATERDLPKRHPQSERHEVADPHRSKKEDFDGNGHFGKLLTMPRRSSSFGFSQK